MSSLASLFTPATRDHLAMPDVQGSVGGRGKGGVHCSDGAAELFRVKGSVFLGLARPCASPAVLCVYYMRVAF